MTDELDSAIATLEGGDDFRSLRDLLDSLPNPLSPNVVGARSALLGVLAGFGAGPSSSPLTGEQPGEASGTMLGVGTITAELIAAAAIIAGKIAAGAVTAEKLSIGAAQAASLVSNHSFEDVLNSIPVGWAAYDVGGVSTAFSEASAAGVKDGALAFTFQANLGVGNRVSYISRNFPVQPGEQLFGSAWYRFSATTIQGAFFRLLFFKNDGTASATPSLDFVANAGGTTGVYNEGRGYLTVPADATQAAVVIYLYQPDVTTFLSWDKIVVQRMSGGVKNSDGNVQIDATGIVINNGKLTFADQFGANAMNGYGFGQSWVRFIRDGFYNGDFISGSTADIPVSEVGAGTPLANYLASLSTLLPSWVVGASGGVLKLIADALATGGLAIQSTATVIGQVNLAYQDIPVIPQQAYRIDVSAKWTAAANNMVFKTYLSWRDSTHAIIGARVNVNNLTFAANNAAYGILPTDTNSLASKRAPANASYLRFEMEFTHPVNTGGIFWVSDVRAKEVFLEDGNQVCTGFALTIAYQDIVVVTLAAGRYVVWASILASMTTAGIGDINVDIELDGVQQNNLGAIWSAPAAVAKSPIATQAYVNVAQGVAGVLKVRALKTINAGVATISANSIVTILGVK